MSKISNVLTMLEYLSSGRKYSIKELSDKLEVTPRISYELGETEEDCIDFDIDQFQAIPPFMEIDLANLSKHGFDLQTILAKLGLSEHRVVVLGTEAIHALYGIDYFEAYSTKKLLHQEDSAQRKL